MFGELIDMVVKWLQKFIETEDTRDFTDEELGDLLGVGDNVIKGEMDILNVLYDKEKDEDGTL